MKRHRYEPMAKRFEIWENQTDKYPIRVEYRWGVWDNEREGYVVVLRSKWFALARAERICRRLNRRHGHIIP